MSMHTPGPWSMAHEGGADGGYFIEGKDQVVILSAARIDEPDARLIAAAPDLLVALKNLQHALAWHCAQGVGPKGMDKEFLRQARAAIAKAEGTS